jgi:hypothetical protein
VDPSWDLVGEAVDQPAKSAELVTIAVVLDNEVPGMRTSGRIKPRERTQIRVEPRRLEQVQPLTSPLGPLLRAEVLYPPDPVEKAPR